MPVPEKPRLSPAHPEAATSDGRLDLDPERVRRLIAAQFPKWSHLPLGPRSLDGWDNCTFRLGSDMKVRLPRAARYAAQVAKEHRWLPLLAPLLPLPIPTPLARGVPGEGFPWPWSVQLWLEGEPAASAPVPDLPRLATELATFLLALQNAPAEGGPAPGPHSFFRGGSLANYDADTRGFIEASADGIDATLAAAVWEAALAAPWRTAPV